jgi:hypothetical protein
MRDERPSIRAELRETARNARNAWRASLLALRAMLDGQIRAVEREQERLRSRARQNQPARREQMAVEDGDASAAEMDNAPPQMPHPEGGDEPPHHGIV